MSKKKKNKKKEYGVNIDKIIFRTMNNNYSNDDEYSIEDAIDDYVEKHETTLYDDRKKLKTEKNSLYGEVVRTIDNVLKINNDTIEKESEEKLASEIAIDKKDNDKSNIIESIDNSVSLIKIDELTKIEVKDRFNLVSYYVNMYNEISEIIESKINREIDDLDIIDIKAACALQITISLAPVATYTIDEFNKLFDNVLSFDTDKYTIVRDEELNIAHGFIISDKLLNDIDTLVSTLKNLYRKDDKAIVGILAALTMHASNNIWIDKEFTSMSAVNKWINSSSNLKEEFKNMILNDENTKFAIEKDENTSDAYYEITDEYSFLSNMIDDIFDSLTAEITEENVTGASNDNDPFREDDFKYECESEEIKKEEEKEISKSENSNEENEDIKNVSDISDIIKETNPDEFTLDISEPTETFKDVNEDNLLSKTIPVIRG